MPETRPPGWFWVKFSGPPEIGWWDGHCWLVVGCGSPVMDKDVQVLAKAEVPAAVREE